MSRRVSELKIARDNCEQRRLRESEKAARRAQLLGQRNDVATAAKGAQEFEKAMRACRDAQTELVRCSGRHDSACTALDDARRAFQDAEAGLSRAQALHLATKLFPGDPCPVCGSQEHPSPATGSPKYQGLDSDFRTTKLASQTAQAQEQQAKSALVAAQTTVQMHEQALASMEPPRQTAADYRTRMAGIDEEIDALGPEVDPSVILVELDGLAGKLVDAERLREQTQTALYQAQREDAAAKARLDQALSSIPVELRQREALERNLADTRLRYAKRLRAIEIAKRTKDETANAALAAKHDFMAAIEAHQNAISRREAARALLHQRLVERNLSEADYQSFKRFIPSIENDKVAIDAFKRSLNLARDGFAAALKAVESLARPDLTMLTADFTDAQHLATTALEQRVKTENHLENPETLRRTIEQEQKCLEALELKSEPLRELAGLCTGGNTSKLELLSRRCSIGCWTRPTGGCGR